MKTNLSSARAKRLALIVPYLNAFIKDNVQATLRRNIRRILRKHGYPPDLQERVIQMVIDQARLLANDLVAN
jgi:hypothetical protein